MSIPAVDGSSIPLGISLPADDIPLALPAPLSLLAPSAQSRRLPPPCWSHDETVALIGAYRDKWYALRRGNLKANHWQEVADAVGRMCASASPRKTAVQCRHKMEKLRKRYRTEIQRSRSMPTARFSSAWVHFQRMDAMEKGPYGGDDHRHGLNSDNGVFEDNDVDGENESIKLLTDQFNCPGEGIYANGYRNSAIYSQNRSHKVYDSRNGLPCGGFKIRIPSGVSIAQPPPSSHKANLFSPCRTRSEGREREAMEEMVAAVKLLGDGFVRMEQMKIEMAREMEAMRMKMEMKRTQMILDSQQRIVEAFAKAFTDTRGQQDRMTHKR